MKAKKRRILYSIIITLWLAVSVTDYVRTLTDRSPVFAIPVTVYQDGGSVEYYGAGYKVIRYANLHLPTQEYFYVMKMGYWWMDFDQPYRENSSLTSITIFVNLPVSSYCPKMSRIVGYPIEISCDMADVKTNRGEFYFWDQGTGAAAVEQGRKIKLNGAKTLYWCPGGKERCPVPAGDRSRLVSTITITSEKETIIVDIHLLESGKYIGRIRK